SPVGGSWVSMTRHPRRRPAGPHVPESRRVTEARLALSGEKATAGWLSRERSTPSGRGRGPSRPAGRRNAVGGAGRARRVTAPRARGRLPGGPVITLLLRAKAEDTEPRAPPRRRIRSHRAVDGGVAVGGVRRHLGRAVRRARLGTRAMAG